MAPHGAARAMLAAAAVALSMPAAAQPGSGRTGEAWRVEVRTRQHNGLGTLAQLDSPQVRQLAGSGGRNIAYVDDEARLSRDLGDWRVSLLARNTATLVTDGDTLQALRHAAGERAGTQDAAWRLQARFSGIQGAGLEIGRSIPLPHGFQARVELQGLLLTRWREREVAGLLQYAAASGDYGFDLAAYSRGEQLRFPFQQGHAARGWGLLLGGELAWASERLRLAVQLRDLGWLGWDRLPQQRFTLSSSTRQVNAEGEVVYQPLLQGRNTQDRLREHADPRWTASAAWRISDNAGVEAEVEGFRGSGPLPMLAWRQGWHGIEATLGWRVREKVPVLGLRWAGLELQFSGDGFGSDAHTRHLLLRYRLAF